MRTGRWVLMRMQMRDKVASRDFLKQFYNCSKIHITIHTTVKLT